MALCGTQCKIGCNARCGMMHNCGRYQWCDLKYIAKWNSPCAARGAGVI